MKQPSHAHSTKSPNAHLRILETTDLHVHIMPYDYFTDTPARGTGLAHTATLIHQARATSPNTLLFDNGDFLQGNLMSDWAAAQPWDTPHPVIAAMNTLDYDAATLGNHEFNYGLGMLSNTMTQANFPFVSANITTVDNLPLTAPWRILERTITDTDGKTHILNIGVIGFAPPQTGLWDRYTKGAEIAAQDIITTAQTELPKLQAAGADFIIALCHSGIGDAAHTDGMENAAVPLAALDGIDVLLTGHIHQHFPKTDGANVGPIDAKNGALHGKPTVMAGFHGSHLGQIDLTLTKSQNGWTITDYTCVALPAHNTAPDPAIIDSAKQAHDQTLQMIRAPIATITAPVLGHFATVAPSASFSLLSDAMYRIGTQALAQTSRADLPLLCAVAPYTAGGWNRPNAYIDIPAGPIAVRHAADIYPFPNDLCLIELGGQDIRLWLERAANAFLQITPGITDQPLIDTGFPSYDFDVMHGLRYVIDPSQPTGNRISNITLADGTDFTDDTRVIVAANGYRAAGGGSYHMAGSAAVIPHPTRPLRDILIDDLRQQKTVTPAATPTWSFAPLPDTAAWFESSANGVAHLSRPENAHISSDRTGRDGLHRYTCRFP